jgi:hypothetical protein
MNAAKFFRIVWRVNALVILLVAGAIALGAGSLLIQQFRPEEYNRRAQTELRVDNATDPKARLVLGEAKEIGGFLRVELVRADGDARLNSGFSKSVYRPAINILFIQAGEKAGRWLLADNDHVLVEDIDVRDEQKPKSECIVATAILAKPAAHSEESDTGKLVLFNPAGKIVVNVADNVRTIQLASIANADLTVLYEQDRRLVLASFDPVTLQKRHEDQIEIPKP